MRKKSPKQVSHDNHTEELLADDEWLITLRDGTQVDGREVVADLRMLQTVIERESGSLALLHAHAHGEPIRSTKKWLEIFVRDGSLDPTVKAIILNGVEDGEAGLELREPWDDTDKNRNVLSTVADNRGIFLGRLMDELRDQSDEQNPDRTR